jgi:hypothetical protein
LQAAYCFLDHPIAEPKPTSTTAIANSELDAQDRQRRRTEELIRELKNKKATLGEVEYSKRLETYDSTRRSPRKSGSRKRRTDASIFLDIFLLLFVFLLWRKPSPRDMSAAFSLKVRVITRKLQDF